jgi:hypothetical protein
MDPTIQNRINQKFLIKSSCSKVPDLGQHRNVPILYVSTGTGMYRTYTYVQSANPDLVKLTEQTKGDSMH